MALNKNTYDELRKRLMLDYNLYSRPICYKEGTYNVYIEEKKIVVWTSQNECNQDGWKAWEREGWKIIKESNLEKILFELNKIL